MGQALFARKIRVNLAIDGWRGGEHQLYGVGYAMTLALVRKMRPQYAATLHDQAQRKPFAISPLHVAAPIRQIARAELTICAWERGLGEVLAEAFQMASTEPLLVAGLPACVLSVEVDEPTTADDFLSSRVEARKSSVPVAFTSPTFFSLGRGVAIQHRYGLLPEPGMVVASWLRVWTASGGPAFGTVPRVDWIAERVTVRHASRFATVTVPWTKTALTGFIGEIAYEWVGPERWGSALLHGLVHFAEYCGTGAKTVYGFGQTQRRQALPARALRTGDQAPMTRSTPTGGSAC